MYVRDSKIVELMDLLAELPGDDAARLIEKTIEKARRGKEIFARVEGGQSDEGD